MNDVKVKPVHVMITDVFIVGMHIHNCEAVSRAFTRSVIANIAVEYVGC